LATVYCLFPIYFMLVQSLKTAQEDIFGNPLIVLHPTLENFEELFERKGETRGFVGSVLRRSYPFLDWLENTLVVFAGTVSLTLVVSVAAAYALGRLRPPGFRWWRRVIFATYVIPQTILPMRLPVLVAAGIFPLGTIASDFMIASVFLLSPENQTIPAGLGTVEVALDELAAVAGINLLAIPVLVISALFARGYVRG